jgi:hypothetical protein
MAMDRNADQKDARDKHPDRNENILIYEYSKGYLPRENPRPLEKDKEEIK